MPCDKCGRDDLMLRRSGHGEACQPDKVVLLQFKSPHVEEDTMAFLSCTACRNKTYTLTFDRPGEFPMMRCACCGAHVGRMGWAHDDDPAKSHNPG